MEKDEEIPCDLLCIAAPKDLVFVSTMNLDGETNLKERMLGVNDIGIENLSKFQGKVECDAPNESLDYWNGNIHSD